MKRTLWTLAVAVLGAVLAVPVQARPDKPLPGEMWKYAPGDLIEQLDSLSGNFRLHFTRKGAHAVPEGDIDNSGKPDHVEQLAATYDQALAFYEKLGFNKPPSDGTGGGDGRFDVYLVDFAGKGDGNFVQETCKGDVCVGFMVQENDFAGYGYPSIAYANKILSSHEFFHAIQAGYDAKQSSIIGEGSAVWATEQFDPALQDFENFLPGFLKHPDRSLDKPMLGPVDKFSYGSALFFQYLNERYLPATVLHLWQDCQDNAQGVANPSWFTALAALLIRDHKTTFAEEFATFVSWNLFTGPYADPTRSYAKGASFPQVAMLSDTLPYRDNDLRVFYASSQYLRLPLQARTAVTAAVAATTDSTGLRVGLVARKGKQFGEWLWLLPPFVPPLPTLDVTGADELFVVAVNTAQTGESVRGSLCAGTPDEAALCLPKPPADDVAPTRADALGTETASDEASGGAQIEGGDAGAATKSAPSAGCAAAPTGAGATAWLAGLAVAAWARRQRRCGVPR